MASRKEERERLRQIRREAEAREAHEQRRRLILGYAVAGVLGLAVIAGVVAVILSGGGGASGEARVNTASGDTNGVPLDEREGTPPPPVENADPAAAARQAGCVLRRNLRDEGHTHIPEGSQLPDYRTNPPTSGSHLALPQADGAYIEMPDPLAFLHSLEHGRMEIQYSPDLPERDQLALRGLYDTMYAGALIFPNGEMPFDVAATTWTNLLGCEEFRGSATLDAIRAFGRATWGRFGGEGLGVISGPSPASPSS
jgi:hypothetical protein